MDSIIDWLFIIFMILCVYNIIRGITMMVASRIMVIPSLQMYDVVYVLDDVCTRALVNSSTNETSIKGIKLPEKIIYSGDVSTKLLPTITDMTSVYESYDKVQKIMTIKEKCSGIMTTPWNIIRHAYEYKRSVHEFVQEMRQTVYK